MRWVILVWLTFAGSLSGCSNISEDAPTSISRTAVRTDRRAFDGAPPIIPHVDYGASCTACHFTGADVLSEGASFAPPSPHALTEGMGERRCEQCHVPQHVMDVLVENRFEGLAQDVRRGDRLHPYAAPVMPHQIHMREDCLACHGGDTARPEIRTSHPERGRCMQCHVPQATETLFPTRP